MRFLPLLILAALLAGCAATTQRQVTFPTPAVEYGERDQ